MCSEYIMSKMIDLKTLAGVKVDNQRGEVNWALNVKLTFTLLAFIVDRNVSSHLTGILLTLMHVLICNLISSSH